MESSSSSGSPPADVDLPTGTVSFLFTDRGGSTRLLEALGAGYGALIETHRSIVDSSVREHGGLVFETEGDARLAGGGYYGMSLHETARVCSAGHGGQVLLTGVTRALVPGRDVRDLGEHRLKDLSEAVRVVQLRCARSGAGGARTHDPGIMSPLL